MVLTAPPSAPLPRAPSDPGVLIRKDPPPQPHPQGGDTRVVFIAAEDWNHPKSPTIGKQLSKLRDADKQEPWSTIRNDERALRDYRDYRTQQDQAPGHTYPQPWARWHTGTGSHRARRRGRRLRGRQGTRKVRGHVDTALPGRGETGGARRRLGPWPEVLAAGRGRGHGVFSGNADGEVCPPQTAVAHASNCAGQACDVRLPVGTPDR